MLCIEIPEYFAAIHRSFELSALIYIYIKEKKKNNVSMEENADFIFIFISVKSHFVASDSFTSCDRETHFLRGKHACNEETVNTLLIKYKYFRV